MTSQKENQVRVGLFLTCAVDLMRPSVGFAALKLLEEAGCRVTVPPQSCCGQMAYNNGLPAETRALAREVTEAFAEVDYVVVPSGSCASMLKNHYPALFDHEDEAVNTFAAKVFELTCFLTGVLGRGTLEPEPDSEQEDRHGRRTIAYHDSCAGLRELGIREQPRALIRERGEDRLAEIPEGDVCCGFGGTFCVKFADISNKMAGNKVANLRRVAPDLLLGGDLTCLMNLSGKLQRQGDSGVEVRHVAEYLAGDFATPAIGMKK